MAAPNRARARSKRGWIAGLAVVASLSVATPDARAATITASDLPSGANFVDLGFATVFSGVGEFTRKFVAGYEVAGALGGYENGEIDTNAETFAIRFTTPQVVTELVLGLLYAAGEEDDAINEEALVVGRPPKDQIFYIFSVIDGTTASYSGFNGSVPVANISPGTFGNAGVWSIKNPFGELALSELFLVGFTLQSAPPDYRNSDFGLVSLSTVPEPGTVVLLGLGLAGLGLQRRLRSS